MPTGATSAWGYPIGAVGGQFNTMLQGDHPLTYEQSMTSYPAKFPNGKFQSPLTQIAAGNLSGFGYKPRQRRGVATLLHRSNLYKRSKRKVKRFSKKMCKKFLKKKNINPLTGRKIKRNGKIYKRFIKDCKFYKLKTSKKKTSKKKV
jgi:hypothetical protein